MKKRKERHAPMRSKQGIESKAQYDQSYREAHREQESARACAWNAANKEWRRAYRLAKRYGLTVEEWTSLYQRQNGLCPICNEVLHDVVVDHCHTTGKVRGLLCRRCNAGLGNFDDCANTMLRAYQYLTDCSTVQH